jgi:hypothetical protein
MLGIFQQLKRRQTGFMERMDERVDRAVAFAD